MDINQMFAIVQRQLRILSRLETKPRYEKGRKGTHIATFTPRDYTRPECQGNCLIVEVQQPPNYSCLVEGERFMKAWAEIEVRLKTLGWKKQLS